MMINNWVDPFPILPSQDKKQTMKFYRTLVATAPRQAYESFSEVPWRVSVKNHRTLVDAKTYCLILNDKFGFQLIVDHMNLLRFCVHTDKHYRKKFEEQERKA